MCVTPRSDTQNLIVSQLSLQHYHQIIEIIILEAPVFRNFLPGSLTYQKMPSVNIRCMIMTLVMIFLILLIQIIMGSDVHGCLYSHIRMS